MRDLSLHIMDLMQNSIVALCNKITVSINADISEDLMEIKVADDGTGMDEEMVASVTSPFTTTRTTRKVGLGLPLLMDSARMAGGDIEVQSQKNVGTVVKAGFRISHIDRIPLGGVAETITTVIASNPDIEILLSLSNNKETFALDTGEIRQRLGEVPITNLEVIEWMREYIEEGVKLVFGGVLNEVVG